MHRRKLASIVVVAVAFLALLAYVILRVHTTRMADRDIDAFFRDFARTDATLVGKHLSCLTQRREVADAIISRHKDAIRNFDYSKITPSLNVMLNRTVVEVSWHLRIVFGRRADGWRILSFDEFVAEPQPQVTEGNLGQRSINVPSPTGANLGASDRGTVVLALFEDRETDFWTPGSL
jgi:hypothetical protein